MVITAEQNHIYSTAYKNIVEVLASFGLPESYASHPGIGKWIIDQYAQKEQANRMYRGARMATDPVQSPDKFTNFPDLPPLVEITPKVESKE